MLRRSSRSSDDDQGISVNEVCYRLRPRLPRFAPGRGEEQRPVPEDALTNDPTRPTVDNDMDLRKNAKHSCY
jgi:hypothetical protein